MEHSQDQNKTSFGRNVFDTLEYSAKKYYEWLCNASFKEFIIYSILGLMFASLIQLGSIAKSIFGISVLLKLFVGHKKPKSQTEYTEFKEH